MTKEARPVLATEIIYKLDISKVMFAAAILRLSRKGLIHKDRATKKLVPQGGRSYLYSLTAHGHEATYPKQVLDRRLDHRKPRRVPDRIEFIDFLDFMKVTTDRTIKTSLVYGRK